MINLTADARTLDLAAPHISEFLSALPERSAASAAASWTAGAMSNLNEALTVPTQV